MRKHLYSCVAVLALLASTGVAANAADPSTWRWTVSSVIEAQNKSDKADDAALAAADFRQHYERYSPIGILETGR